MALVQRLIESHDYRVNEELLNLTEYIDELRANFNPSNVRVMLALKDFPEVRIAQSGQSLARSVSQSVSQWKK